MKPEVVRLDVLTERTLEIWKKKKKKKEKEKKRKKRMLLEAARHTRDGRLTMPFYRPCVAMATKITSM